MHHSRVFQYALIAFLGGVALAPFFSIPVVVLWALVAGGAVLLMMPQSRPAGIFLFAAVFGLWLTAFSLDTPSPLAPFLDESTTVTGYVAGTVTTNRTGIQYPFQVLTVGESLVSDRILVFGPDTIRPRYGQVLALTGTLHQSKRISADGTRATLSFPSYAVPLDWQPSLLLRTRLALLGTLYRFRDGLAGSIIRSVRAPESSFLAGILVGAQGIVPPEVKNTFARTGTSHILAISGYNITIVASVLAGLLLRFGRNRSYWLTVLGISLFTLMVGATASVVRAAVMGILALTGQRLGRQTDSGTAIVLAGAVMCAFNPLLLRWDVGFQLSFLALLGIVYLQPRLEPVLVRLVRWPALAQMTAATLAASLMVLPLSLFTFGQLAVYTLPANLLVLPLVPLAMALGLATGLAGLVLPVVGQFIGQTAWLVATYQLGVVRFFAGLPSSAVAVHLSFAALVAAYAGLATWLILGYRTSP